MTIRTLNDVFFTVVERNSDRVMLTRESGVWTPISAAQLQAQVFATARQLQAWGIGKSDRVAILSENRPEWAIADFATLLLGAVDVPIYATQTAEQCVYLLQHSEASIVFVSTPKQYEKIAVRPRTRPTFNVSSSWMTLPSSPTPLRCRAFCGMLPRTPDPELEDLARAAEPDDLATLIYTSGTTGTPKGVMLTHGNIASNLSVSLDMFDVGKEDLGISFLPLSHVTARHLDYAMMY